eukprot:1911919-Rhodomonas_salina.1
MVAADVCVVLLLSVVGKGKGGEEGEKEEVGERGRGLGGGGGGKRERGQRLHRRVGMSPGAWNSEFEEGLALAAGLELAPSLPPPGTVQHVWRSSWLIQYTRSS